MSTEYIDVADYVKTSSGSINIQYYHNKAVLLRSRSFHSFFSMRSKKRKTHQRLDDIASAVYPFSTR